MTDTHKLIALAHAMDAHTLYARRIVELFGAGWMMHEKTTLADEAQHADEWRASDLAPGNAPFEKAVAVFEEVLAGYGYVVLIPDDRIAYLEGLIQQCRDEAQIWRNTDLSDAATRLNTIIGGIG